MTHTTSAPAVSSGRVAPSEFEYQPALDGVRALAVIAVVAFHAGATWAPGGYLGVSVFFTLSGYLITAVLLREHDARGRIDLPRFFSRRIRRLAPASLVTLGVLTVLALAGIGGATPAEPGHIRWASAHLANQDQLSSGNTYADAVTGSSDQSSVLHFWSLAIEEQFYLVWPIVMVLGLAMLVRSGFVRWFVVVPVSALVLAWSYIALLSARGDTEAVYLSSGSRGAEILTGCVVAAALHVRPATRPGRSAIAPVCAVAIAACVVLTGSSNEAWPYHGGLAIFALLSAGLIVGLQHSTFFSAALGARALVWVGRRSYGIYLYHWPVFVLVPLESAGALAHGFRLVVVVGLAGLSYRWLEQPLRASSANVTVTVAAAVGGAALVIGSTFLVDSGPAAITTIDEIDPTDRALVELRDDETPASTGAVPDVAAAPAPTTASTDRSSLTTLAPEGSGTSSGTIPATGRSERETATTTTGVAAADSARIVVVGDSTAVALSAGLVDWAASSDDDVQIGIAAHGGCGLVRGGSSGVEVFDAALALDCPENLDRRVPQLLATAPIDLVVVMVSLADTWERSWDDGGTFTLPTDLRHGERVRADYESFVDDVTSRGARSVVFVRPPVAYRGVGLDEPEPAWVNGAAEVVDGIAVDIASERDDVEILDLRAFVEDAGLDDDETLRPDGIHWTANASARLAGAWLGPSLLALARS